MKNKGSVAGAVRCVSTYVTTERVRTVSTCRPSGYVKKEARDTQHSRAQHTALRKAQQTEERKGHTWGVEYRPRRAQPDQQDGKNRQRDPLVTDRMLQRIRKLVTRIRM